MSNSNKVVVVTGGAGFIGSNLIKMLNDNGITNIIVVDDLTDGKKYKNLKDLQFSSYIDKDDFLDWFRNEGIFYEESKEQALDFMGMSEDEEGNLFVEMTEKPFQSNVACVFHMGAISNTQEWNGKKMMDDNYSYTTELLHICQFGKIPFVYASSASVYGNTKGEGYDPLNIYAFSKMAIDQYVSKFMQDKVKQKEEFSPIIGLRFFNVYGPREDHKWTDEIEQCSPIHKWLKSVNEPTKIRISTITIFDEPSFRDFVYVEDVCSVMLWFLSNPCSGIFDVGTGVAVSFEDVATCIVSPEEIDERPFPENLKDHYQYFTQANLEPLRSVGCNHEFLCVKDGIRKMKEEIK